MAEGGLAMVETGMTFVTLNGNRWMKHTSAVDSDFVVAHIEGKALVMFQALTAMEKLLVIRAVTELSMCKFRQTRKDPDYDLSEYEAWIRVIVTLIGSEGIERLGV